MAAAIVTTTKLSTTGAVAQQQQGMMRSGSYVISEGVYEEHQHQNVRIVHKIGDLVWAKLSANPWWPCCVVKDVSSERFYHVVDGDKLMFHVEFMGGVKERGWVNEANMFKYDGIDSFKTYAQDQVDRAVSKIEKEQLAERFQLKVSLNRKEMWQRAVQCADDFVRSIKNLKRKRENTRERNVDETFEDIYHKKCMMNGVKNENVFKLNEMQNKPETILINNSNSTGCLTTDTKTLSERNHSYVPVRKMVPNLKHDDSTSTITNSNNSSNKINRKENYPNLKEETNENYLTHVNRTSDQEDQESDEDDNEAPTQIYDHEHHLTQTYGQKPYNAGHNDYLLSNQDFNQEDSKQLTITSILNEKHIHQSELNNKKRGRKPKTPSPPVLADNQLKLKIKLSQTNGSGDSPTRSRSNISMGSSKRSTSSDTSTSNSLESDGRPKTIYAKKDFASLSFKTNPTTNNKNKPEKDQICSYSNLAKKSHTIPRDDEQDEDDDDDEEEEEDVMTPTNVSSSTETYLIDRYKYAVRHIQQGLSVEEACNKYRISKGALLKCLSGGTAPRGKKTRLTEAEEKEIVDWLINYKDLKYNDAIHLVFDQVVKIFEQTKRPNPFNNGKPSMDWWYDFLSRHPQIMASKPDWLKRGKVNDKYIQDVQSGQLKCTKFRRALLSAIQYINSLNEDDRVKCNFALSSTGSSSAPATAKNTLNKSKKYAQQKSTPNKSANSTVKNKKCPTVDNRQPYEQLQVGAEKTVNNNVDKNLSTAQTWQKPAPVYTNFANTSTSSLQTRFDSLMDNYPNMLDVMSTTQHQYQHQQQQAHVDYASKLKDEPEYCNGESQLLHHMEQENDQQHHELDDDEQVDDHDSDNDDDDDDDDDDDENNLTFGNELFIHSPLNDNEFENLIDSSELIDREDHNQHQHDINNNYSANNNNCLLNQKQRANLNSSHFNYQTQSDLKPCQHHNHHHHHHQMHQSIHFSQNSNEFQPNNNNILSQQHLLVPDDDDEDHHHHHHQSNNYKCQNDTTNTYSTNNLHAIKSNDNVSAVSALNSMGNSNLINDDEDELMVNTIDPSTFLT